MLVVDLRVGRAGEGDDLVPDRLGDAPGRPAAAVAVDEGLGPTLAVGRPQATDLADGQGQEIRSLDHEELTPFQGIEDQKLLLSTLRQDDRLPIHASRIRAGLGRTFSLKS